MSNFTKKDLRNGDILVDRNGDMEIFLEATKSFICHDGGVNFLEDLNNDLTSVFSGNGSNEEDIMEVYRAPGDEKCPHFHKFLKSENLVYIREDPFTKWVEQTYQMFARDGSVACATTCNGNKTYVIVFDKKTCSSAVVNCDAQTDQNTAHALAYAKLRNMEIPERD